VRSARREIWEILKLWWLVVPGGALGVIAIVAAVRGAGHETVWFWGFWAMTALFTATCVRLWRVVQERDEALAASSSGRQSLDPWLDERSEDMQALAERLREQAAVGPVVDIPRCEAIQGAFWQLSSDVLARLHIEAPEWAEYYMQNPDWYRLDGVTAMRPEQFEERAKLIDYTVDQIAHIRARLK